LVFASRREDDEESFEEEMSDDESAVSPVIATILMVAITVVLSGVVYVWAAQLADVDTKGVPRVTFTAENVDTGNLETDHWKFTVGQSQTALATQAVFVEVTYTDANGDSASEEINLASTDQVYGFSPFNSDSLVTFGDVTGEEGSETVSSFGSGDDIFVKTHIDGHALVGVTVTVTYSPPVGDGALLVKFTGLAWDQPA
jgi:flagellin-like protein